MGVDVFWFCFVVKIVLVVVGSFFSFSYRSSWGVGSRVIVGYGGWFWSFSWMVIMGERLVVSERV